MGMGGREKKGVVMTEIAPPLYYSSALPDPVASSLPVVIDWAYWLKRRPLVLELNEDVPAYLVLPEVRQVLAAAKDFELHFLLNTLWHTGGRISEVLAMTRDSICLDGVRNSYVVLSTLKKPGRPKKAAASPRRRMVPIFDALYLDEAERYLASVRPTKGQLLFSLNRDAVSYQLKKLHAALDLPIDSLGPHVFRHSFAINALYHGIGITVIQGWLGHSDARSTEIYLKVLSGETHHLMAGVQY